MDHYVDIKIEVQSHDGWTGIYHRDIIVRMASDAKSFQESLKKRLEEILDGNTSYNHVTHGYLINHKVVLSIVHSYDNDIYKSRFNTNQIYVRMDMNWDNNINKFAKVIWESLKTN